MTNRRRMEENPTGYMDKRPHTLGISRAGRGSGRSVVDIFLASTTPDLPAVHEDIRAGRQRPPELSRIASRVASAEEELRSLRAKIAAKDRDPTEHEQGRIIKATQELAALLNEQAEEALEAMTVERPAISAESARAKKYIDPWRRSIMDSVVDASDYIDDIHLSLAEPPLTHKERKFIGDIAGEMILVGTSVAENLEAFIKAESLHEEEKKRLQEAQAWLVLSIQALSTVPMYISHLNSREEGAIVGLDAAVREVLLAMVDEESELEDLDDEFLFKMFSDGIRGFRRAYDKMYSAKLYATSAMALREKTEMEPNARWPRCCADI